MSRKGRKKNNNRTRRSQPRRPPAPPPNEASSRVLEKPTRGSLLKEWGGTIGLLIAVLTLGISVGHLYTKLNAVEQDRDRLQARENGWKFSEPLYRQIPGDVDFVARKMRVDKKQGAQLSVAGPKKGDLYTIIISNLTSRETDSEGNQQYIVRFTVQGFIDNNEIKGGLSEPILMSPNNLAGPVEAIGYKFYIFVDKVDIDYVNLTFARRKTDTTIKFSYVTMPLGRFNITDDTEPEAIMTASPDSP